MKYFSIITLTCLLFTGCNQKKQNQEVGVNITDIPSPADSSSAEPFLFSNEHGVYLSWVENINDTSYLKYSSLNNDRWAEPGVIAKGNNWFVNWADFPAIAVGSNGNWLAHYLEKSGEGTYAYDVKVLQSNDQGKSWSAPRTLHDDGKQAEHGFVSMLPYKNNFFITWLDGRNTVSEAGTTDHGHADGDHGSAHGAMTLRAAIIDPKGNKIEEWELDSRVCDCCQTTAAITDQGPVVIYRDRTENEIRDMSIVRWTGNTWTASQPIHNDHWKIAGCPVNGPKVAGSENTLAVAWFSAPEGNAQVKLAFSTDGGATFEKPVQIDSGKTIGRVDVLLLSKEVAMVSWMEGNNIKAIKVNKDEVIGNPIIIGSSSESRSSGFPKMTKNGDDVIFAWTDHNEKIVKTAVLNNP